MEGHLRFLRRHGLAQRREPHRNVTSIDYFDFFILTWRDFQSFVTRHPELRERLDKIAAKREEMNREA